MAAPDPSAEPYSDEDEALAHLHVGKALEKYRSLMPADALEDLRALMIDELLATADGRRKLWMLKGGQSRSDPSAEQEIFRSPVVAEDKKRSGST